jgi:hypothetical protein
MNDNLNHLMACTHCPKYSEGCTIYNDTSWVNRIGGCPSFPFREIPRVAGEYVDGKIVSGNMRPGQQKQKKADRSYDNKKSKRKYGRGVH